MPNLNDLLGEQFDADVIEIQDFTPAPEGWYMLAIDKTEFRPTKTGGKMLVVAMKIMVGEHECKMVMENLNLVNKSEIAVKIAKESLSKLCKAVGVTKPKDTAELHNRPFYGYLKLESYVKRDDSGKEITRHKNALDKAVTIEQYQENYASQAPAAAAPAEDATPSWMAPT